ncbi:MAG: response regulator [Candidatus Omnitrophica bacterium]|nr:response regulator [Candidatus Omnitrophota bacterium]
MAGEGKIKAIVVDDEDIVRDFLARLLGFRGVEVKTVSSGELAVEMVAKEKFDIAFLDVRMPKMNGLDTFRALKKVSPQTKYVMMTGYTVDDLLLTAEKEGASLSLKKPFDINEIMTALGNVVPQDKSGKIRFLVVDDERIVLNFFKNLFKDAKYEIVFASNGKLGYEEIKKGVFDLVFLDICLGDMSGLDLYYQLQKEKPDVKIILMTGSSEKAAKLEHLQLKGCIYKPFDIDKIFEMVDKLKN